MAMLSHRQGWLSVLASLISPVLLFAGSGNDARVAAYRITTSEVRVVFFATDEHNTPLNTIGKDDFAVVDSGMVIREFRSLARSEETTLDIVAVVDASGSVASRYQSTTRDVLQLVSQRPDDRFSVVTFNGLQPALLCADDCGTPAAAQRLAADKAGGATSLFDALAYTADFLSTHHTPAARRVVILFSDGNDTISRASARDAVETIIASGALLYAVDLNGDGRFSTGSAALREMTDATGGRTLSIQEGAVRVLQCALDDLRASYVVTYQLPSRAMGFHSLRILPKHNLNLHFHCRKGYYYEELSPQ